MLKTYCVDCHSAAEAAGGVVFEGLGSAIPGEPEVFEAAVRKLRGRLMPPPGKPQPDQPRDRRVHRVARANDRPRRRAHARRPRAGATLEPHRVRGRRQRPARRRDRRGEFLPAEIEVDGFDEHRGRAQHLAGVPRAVRQRRAHSRAPRGRRAGAEGRERRHFPPPDGRPRRLRRRHAARHARRHAVHAHVPGRRRIPHSRSRTFDVGLYPRAVETRAHARHARRPQRGVPRRARRRRGSRAHQPRRRAGARRAHAALREHPGASHGRRARDRVTFIERSRAATDEPIGGFPPYGGFCYRRRRCACRASSAASTGRRAVRARRASRAPRAASKMFVCEPESADTERACAERITTNLARRAFRRPVDARPISNALMPFYEDGRAGAGGFDDGIEHMRHRRAREPRFPVPRDRAVDARRRGEAFALDDSRARVAALVLPLEPRPRRRAAEARRSRRACTSRACSKRKSSACSPTRAPRRSSRTSRCAGSTSTSSTPSCPTMQLFPEFTDELRDDFAHGDAAVPHERAARGPQRAGPADGGLHVRQRAARAPLRHRRAMRGPQFRRVTLDDPARRGLLGKGAVLLRTSYGDRTSPVLRGAWVLDKLMGTPPTPPPPGVETNLDDARGREAEDGARAARAAPREPDLQRLPRRHRSVRLGARELHGDRPVARLRRPSRMRRSTRTELSGRAGRSTGPVRAARRAARARRPVRAGADRRSS